MSAESPRKVNRKGSSGHVVLPHPVSDPSLIDSVAGFIQEVVPQAYSGSSGDSREVITWARVQQADINDPALYPNTGEQDGVPPLLLVLGYGSGVQVWSVPVSGEAREVLSWSQGVVRTLCILPNPEPRHLLKQDLYKHKRTLVAMVDNAGPGPQFCSVSFISLRDGDQVKSIKFSHQVWDVVANKRSVVVTLAERIAVFDAATLEDTLAVTTCYPSPDVNPVALGTRWLAYADRRLVSQWRSLGGCHSEGPQSVTATVFHAAKALGKGLRDLSGTVASSLTGSSPENSYSHSHTPEPCLKGIVTIVDVEAKPNKEASEEDQQTGPNRILAHFNAHFEPIVALSFDPSGLLLVTADKRGHRFHVFRINPHPCGPTLTYVQHLYILHRGDTTARIQDIAFSEDSRWLAISSMRGTTHVFPITPYGGPVGVRTHTTPHVVNKLSRFHRSAGLTDEGRNSPVLWEGPPTTPPPCSTQPAQSAPTTVTALAQVRRQSALTPPTEDSVMRVAASFSAPRHLAPHTASPRSRRAMDCLFIMASNGSLIQYDLEPRHMSGVTKEKVCDDTGVELQVEARAEWVLQRPPHHTSLHPPLPCTNPLLCRPDPPSPCESQPDDERWLSQVEIVTHAGPHRRLWMGPQFTFITVNSNNETGDAIDINKQVVRSSPVNMPLKQPLIIESGSCSSLELSPNMVELVYKTDCSWSCRLREDLAEAMMECPSTRNSGVKGVVRREPVIEHQVNPLGSVVTLTAQLNFPAHLLSDEGKVTVVGTETKKITLESRFNKPVVNSLLHETPKELSYLKSGRISDLDVSSLSVVKNSNKMKKSCDYENISNAKVLSEVTDNITNAHTKVEEDVNDIQEKKGKSGKNRRKVSKGEKNKVKVDVEHILENELLSQGNKVLPLSETEPNVPSVDVSIPLWEGALQGSGDIEMQLREASLERDLEDVIVSWPEDCRGRKRSLENAESKTSNLTMLATFDKMDQKSCEDMKENDKVTSKQRKKSRVNDQITWLSQNSPDEKKLENLLKAEDKDVSFKDMTSKIEEKPKSKKKTKHKKAFGLSEVSCEETCPNAPLEVKKFDSLEFEHVDLEVSQDTVCAETIEAIENSFEHKSILEEQIPEISETFTIPDISSTLLEEQAVNDCNEEQHFIEEKSVTDDELRGLESYLLVKDSSCSQEKNPEKILDTVFDEKYLDKEVDKVKNDETTDKDSSDDCQPVIVKTDSKQAQKKGKSRKLMRKNREVDNKVNVVEGRCEDILEKEVLTKSETLIEKKDEVDKKLTISKCEIIEKSSKMDSEEEEFLENKKNLEQDCYKTESSPDIRMSTDPAKQTDTTEEKESKNSNLSEENIPTRSWSSVVALSFEDPNGNNQCEFIAPVRSWSSIAATPAKSKSQEGEAMKTNSVEDRDSVYESCNDSVGEEVEPTMDSLGSCYFEPDTKFEGEDTITITDENQKVPTDSKSGSSVEDKFNTDSGEKGEPILGIQTFTKKSKKQKKKKR